MDRLHKDRKLDEEKEADRWGNIDGRLKEGDEMWKEEGGSDDKRKMVTEREDQGVELEKKYQGPKQRN